MVCAGLGRRPATLRLWLGQFSQPGQVDRTSSGPRTHHRLLYRCMRLCGRVSSIAACTFCEHAADTAVARNACVPRATRTQSSWYSNGFFVISSGDNYETPVHSKSVTPFVSFHNHGRDRDLGVLARVPPSDWEATQKAVVHRGHRHASWLQESEARCPAMGKDGRRGREGRRRLPRASWVSTTVKR